MTRRELRREGFLVVFDPDDGCRPYAWHGAPGEAVVYTPPGGNRSGRWMDVPFSGWEMVEAPEHIPFELIARDCYCTPVYLPPGGMELCDFCALRRSPDGWCPRWERPADRPGRAP